MRVRDEDRVKMWRRLHAIGTGGLLALAIVIASAAPGPAQSVADVSDVCSDPLSDGARKITLLRAQGWQETDAETAPLAGLARVHMPTVAPGLQDFDARLALAPELAANLRRMIEEGGASLLTLNGQYLFLLVGETPTGEEHLTCLYASPPDDSIFAMMERYGTPNDQTFPGYVVLQFVEQAFVADPERTFDMVSIWSRLDLPEGATDRLTDAYRLERIEAAEAE